jgi:hypothetical protein
MQDVLHRRLACMPEPQILLPLPTVLLLLAIWGTTLGVLRVERVAAGQRAADASRELVDTYEAQVVRALRKIDQILQLVRFLPQRRSGFQTLTRLKNLGLPPLDFLFEVSIADRNGDLVESTRAFA